MQEKLSIKGRDVWVVVEPHAVTSENDKIIPREYFTVSYNLKEPGENNGKIFRDTDDSPKLFESPVAALEYANEKLLEMI